MRVHLRKLLLLAIVVSMIPVVYFLLWAPRTSDSGAAFVQEMKQAQPADTSGTCSYQNCNPVKPGMLNVHIVAHTHDDTGWVKTVDQYYTGQGGGNQKSHSYGGECVSCLMNNVMPLLLENPARRFIYVEMAFLDRWFAEQKADMQAKVRQLVKERRLEIIGGGWCVSDAAAPYYNDIIDQHTLGFDYINRTFGRCAQPRSGWHIDQFGHSREHSSLLAQMGFDSLFMGRIDTQDMDRRKATRNMEFLWKSSPNNLGDKAALFSSVLYDGYFAPSGFRMEGWGPGMINANNGAEWAARFIQVVETWVRSYRSKNVLVTFGGDFAFNTAAGWFANIDELIKHVNQKQAQGGKVNALYSTPACYTYFVNQEKVELEVKKDDLFPYSIVPNAYWTGYFTSRAGLKRHVKVASSLLQTCKVLPVVAQRITDEMKAATYVLKSAVGILQHHDAITGTEKQHVTDDYNKMLAGGEKKCQDVVDTAMAAFAKSGQAPGLKFCPDLNISSCDVTENSMEFQMVAFNSLGWEVTEYVRLPVVGTDYAVTDKGGNSVPSQLLPLSEDTKRIPERFESEATTELVVKATVPPLGFAAFNVKGNRGADRVLKPESPPTGDFTISNDALRLTVDGSTGRFKTLEGLSEGLSISFDQDFRYYLGWHGENRDPRDRTMVGTHRRASGAYAFIPKDDSPPARVNQNGVKVQVFKSDLVQEVHQEFSPWLRQVARLYSQAGYLELEWTVGPIPAKDQQTREIVSMFTTDLASKGRFFTDSNGREMLTRIRNHRETFKWNNTSPFSGNYYPVPSRIYIQDEQKSVQLTVLTDRCEGGSSMQDGQIELMVQRRTLQDDDLGVGEPLDERGVDDEGIIFRGRHYVLLSSLAKAPALHRPLALQINQQPPVAFLTQPNLLKASTFSGLRTPLPSNVHLLTLDQHIQWHGSFLLRLENFYETGETTPSVATVALKRLLTPFDIVSVEELNLGASANVRETTRLRWRGEDGSETPSSIGSDEAGIVLASPFTIHLRPMEIRTFRVTTGKPTAKWWWWGD